MVVITKVPGVAERVETGPIQFGDDWPGVFIRGDNALFYANALEAALGVLPPEKHWTVEAVLKGLLSDLRSCSDTGWPP
jgi:hypothetical protein